MVRYSDQVPQHHHRIEMATICFILIMILTSTVACADSSADETSRIEPPTIEDRSASKSREPAFARFKGHSIGANMVLYHEVQRIALRGSVWSVAWSPSGEHLAILDVPYLDLFDTDRWNQIMHRHVLSRAYGGKSMLFLSEKKILLGGDGLSLENSISMKHAMTIFDMANIGSINEFKGIPKAIDHENGGGFRPQDNFVLSHDQSTLVGWSVDNTRLYVYNMKDLSIAYIIRAQTAPIPGTIFYKPIDPPQMQIDGFKAVAISPDGKQIAACSALGKVYLTQGVTIDPKETLQVFPLTVDCRAIGYSSDGHFLAVGRAEITTDLSKGVAVSGDHTASGERVEGIRIYDMISRLRVGVIDNVQGTVRDIIWIPNMDEIVFADDRSMKIAIRGKTGDFVTEQSLGSGTFKLAISPTGRIAAVQGTEVVIYDIESEDK